MSKQFQKEFEKLEIPTFKYGINILIPPENDYSNLFTIREKQNIENFPPATVEGFVQKNKFSLFNLANNNRSALIEVKEKKDLTINLNCNNTHDYIKIHLHKNAEANIIFILEGNALRTEVIEVIAEENSKAIITTIQNLSENSLNFSTRAAKIEKNAFVEWNDCQLGCNYNFLTSRNILLNGEGNHNSVFYINGKQRANLDISSEHEKGNSKSDIFIKGVMEENSKSLFNGLIKIHPHATNSIGYQKADILLLSEDAEADAIPNLEIDNNDVKCSHGATIGQLDDEDLFYLMARGYSKEDAKKTMIKGFFEKILEKINNEEIKTTLRKTINKKLGDKDE